MSPAYTYLTSYVVGVTSPDARVIVLVSLRATSYNNLLALSAAATVNAVSELARITAEKAFLAEGVFIDSARTWK